MIKQASDKQLILCGPETIETGNIKNLGMII